MSKAKRGAEALWPIKDLGTQLRMMRAERGLTFARIAAKLQEDGKEGPAVSTVKRWEAEAVLPSLRSLYRLHAFFKRERWGRWTTK